MRWTRKNIIEEIRGMKAAGQELNYSTIERDHLNLARAAAWHFGNWRGAIEAAGIDYEGIRKYRLWNRERVVERIRALHAKGADLSWRAISTRIDPPLAAAALRAKNFATWREAIAAAGLQIEDVARYRRWDDERVVTAIRALQQRGEPLSSKLVQMRDQPLFCAARRRFGSWDNALEHAGIASQKRRARTPRIQDASTRGDSNARVLATGAHTKSPARKNEKVVADKSVTARDNATRDNADVKTAPAKRAAPLSPAKGEKPLTAPSATSKTRAAQESAAPSRAASTRNAKNADAKNADAKPMNTKDATPKSRTKKSDASVPENAGVKTTTRKSVASKSAAPKSVASKSVAPKAAAKTSAALKNSAQKTSVAKTPDAKTPDAKAVAQQTSAAKPKAARSTSAKSANARNANAKSAKSAAPRAAKNGGR